jgi:hypothetical protein
MPFLDIVPVSADTIIGKFKGRFQKKNAFFGDVANGLCRAYPPWQAT